MIRFDNKSVSFAAGPLFERFRSALPEKQKAFEAKMQKMSEAESISQRTKSLIQLLQLNNNAKNDVLNKSLYIWLNDVTDGENYKGQMRQPIDGIDALICMPIFKRRQCLIHKCLLLQVMAMRRF